MIRITLLALALSAWAGTAGAATTAPATKKQTPPPPQPAKEVHFPAFEEKTLANGLRVIVIERHEVPAVGLQLLMQAGKAHAPTAKAGLADGTALLLREGTATRSAQQIAEAIDAVGGELSINGSWDSAYASVQVTSDQVGLGLDLLADVVLHPSFPAGEIERWRAQTLNSLQIQQQDAHYLADAVFERAVFGDHPYGLPEAGTPDSVRGITRDDLVAFHHAHYVPNGAILAVVGDIKAADAFARVERAFGGWARGREEQVAPVHEPARDKPRILVIDKPDAVQTEIRVGQVGLAFKDPDHFTSEVYNSVLGEGASARLYEEVRRKRGLSYGAGTAFVAAYQPGWFKASTSTKSETSVEALQVTLNVIADMAKQPVPADELAARKTYLTGVFPLEIETPDGIAGKVLEAYKYGYDRKWLESFRDKLDAVTAEQVQTFAQKRIHPDHALAVLVGNAAAFKAGLEKAFGPVEVIPIGQVDLLRSDLRKPAEPAAK
ncbi:MAG TPA: pitrilysin family protein [Thermoanaerobaculia bacterium]|jgi:zinc protease|nr:pitrilysin family protein [Thermoanaerobaculia bacterium]